MKHDILFYFYLFWGIPDFVDYRFFYKKLSVSQNPEFFLERILERKNYLRGWLLVIGYRLLVIGGATSNQ